MKRIGLSVALILFLAAAAGTGGFFACGGGSSGGGTDDPNGACCGQQNQCAMATSSACTGSGGVWLGTALNCSSNPCGQDGACCGAGGQCVVVSANACVGSNGRWQGGGTVCSPGLCGGSDDATTDDDAADDDSADDDAADDDSADDDAADDDQECNTDALVACYDDATAAHVACYKVCEDNYDPYNPDVSFCTEMFCEADCDLDKHVTQQICAALDHCPEYEAIEKCLASCYTLFRWFCLESPLCGNLGSCYRDLQSCVNNCG